MGRPVGALDFLASVGWRAGLARKHSGPLGPRYGPPGNPKIFFTIPYGIGPNKKVVIDRENKEKQKNERVRKIKRAGTNQALYGQLCAAVFAQLALLPALWGWHCAGI